MKRSSLIAIAVWGVMSTVALANEPMTSTEAYQQVNHKMHQSMNIPFTGNADIDFIQGMIPHHQGAIDMAQVVLKYGKDSEIHKLAQEIIVAQEKEIKFMQEWLKQKKK